MPMTATKPKPKPKRNTINTERLIHDFQLCQKFGYPCRFTVGRNTGYTPAVIKAMERRGYVIAKVHGNCYEITSHLPNQS
ncbi:hypothetical protein [Aeromonas veronii]|uniref:hypothetical protein n=1 Tax=Aeromonas veronii TaxID=654 RepID=UPI000E08F40D|nr:hypothetical protein [Aeromonas veronii]RDE60956.1 hypothetical protein DV708_16785 [Aeromonas veronii]